MKGKVYRFREEKDYVYTIMEDQTKIFVNHTGITSTYKSLKYDDEVEFDINDKGKVPKPVNVKVVSSLQRHFGKVVDFFHSMLNMRDDFSFVSNVPTQILPQF